MSGKFWKSVGSWHFNSGESSDSDATCGNHLQPHCPRLWCPTWSYLYLVLCRQGRRHPGGGDCVVSLTVGILRAVWSWNGRLIIVIHHDSLVQSQGDYGDWIGWKTMESSCYSAAGHTSSGATVYCSTTFFYASDKAYEFVMEKDDQPSLQQHAAMLYCTARLSTTIR